MIVAGVDIGAVSSKAVILDDGKRRASSEVRTRVPKESALRAMEAALAGTGLRLEDIDYVVATGRGRKQVAFASGTVSEIACGAAGAVHIWGPSVRTVLDAGGQSLRVIHCTEKGRATSFLWNDKCAAGIGRSIETFAEIAGRGAADTGAAGSEGSPKLSDFCAVYAQSEALDLVRNKVAPERLVAGYLQAMAKRIATLVGRAGVKEDFVIVGGLAKNRGIVNGVEGILGLSALEPGNEWDPALTAALGAALFADGSSRRQRPAA